MPSIDGDLANPARYSVNTRDGNANVDTAALQWAHQLVADGKRSKVYIPGGDWLISDTVTDQALPVQGSGPLTKLWLDLPDGAALFDPDGRTFAFNDGALRDMSYTDIYCYGGHDVSQFLGQRVTNKRNSVLRTQYSHNGDIHRLRGYSIAGPLIESYGSIDWQVSHIFAQNCGREPDGFNGDEGATLHFGPGRNGETTNNWQISNVHDQGAEYWGMIHEGTSSMNIANMKFEQDASGSADSTSGHLWLRNNPENSNRGQNLTMTNVRFGRLIGQTECALPLEDPCTGYQMVDDKQAVIRAENWRRATFSSCGITNVSDATGIYLDANVDDFYFQETNWIRLTGSPATPGVPGAYVFDDPTNTTNVLNPNLI